MKTVGRQALVTALLACVLLPACAHRWNRTLIDTAAIQHSCPAARVRVVEHTGGSGARIARLDVCGHRRVYQSTASGQWLDTTPVSAASEQPLQPQPAVESSSSPVPTAAHDPFATSVRARITERASAILVCSGGPVAIEARWDPARSSTVSLSTRGVSDTALTECIGAAVGLIDVPFSASPGRIVHAVSN